MTLHRTAPRRKTRRAQAPPPLVLDTGPIFERGDTPCRAIDEAVAQLAPGQPLALIVPFEPVPLYLKLGRLGFTYRSQQLADGNWRVEFQPAKGK